MVKAAKSFGLNAQLMDGRELVFKEEFDAVFSNAALHWMQEPRKVIKSVYRSLKNGGRFAAELGGKGNIVSIIKAMDEVFLNRPEYGVFKNPWFFPSTQEYKILLENSGFEVERIEFVSRPTLLECGIVKWLEIFAAGITEHLSAKQKTVFFIEVEEKLRSTLYRKGKGWTADYVRIRFRAIKS